MFGINMKTRKIIVIVAAAAICLLLGSASGLFTIGEIKGWYQTIEKPSWNPPNWLFGPVWSTLYILMGVAFGLVITQKGQIKRNVVWVFIIQFILNLLWSFIFFKMHNFSLALLEIVVLWIFIFICVVQFYRLNKIAGLLMIPYLVWVSFATILTTSIWTLNT
jgi:benzodiazapine receptor